ncbi:MAG: hypothetical protein WA913_17460, partial [Pricia sp.]
LRYFPILIAYTLCTEVLGWYILKHEEYQIDYRGLAEYYTINNTAIYNIFDIIFFLYFFFIYWKIINNSLSKSAIKYCSLVFVLVSFVNLFFQDFWLFPQIWSIIVGSSLLVMCVCLYLKDSKIGNSKISRRYNLLFWISLGLLVFYPSYPILIIVGVYNSDLYVKWFKELHHVLIAAMYLCFTIGFLSMKRFKFS